MNSISKGYILYIHRGSAVYWFLSCEAEPSSIYFTNHEAEVFQLKVLNEKLVFFGVGHSVFKFSNDVLPVTDRYTCAIYIMKPLCPDVFKCLMKLNKKCARGFVIWALSPPSYYHFRFVSLFLSLYRSVLALRTRLWAAARLLMLERTPRRRCASQGYIGSPESWKNTEVQALQ